MPHKVLDQHADAESRAALQEVFAGFEERPELETRPSAHSRGRTALAVRGGAEIAHLHPADGSLHVSLAPLDARVVVARRWGEFHPLAGVARGLPEGWVLLYPPRDPAAARRIAAILTAAVDHAIPPTPQTPEPDRDTTALGFPTIRPT
ncbi:luciferase family protein [Pseudonocardia xishanensis]